jgi:L-fuconolactonase
MIVDAHVHLWDARHTPQPWMTGEHAAIAQPFGPRDLRPLLEANGIDAVVLVQGACLDSDTDYLLAEASRHPWIGAVTAWLALDDPGRARTRLVELETRPGFRAVRHLVHNEEDPHWILQPRVLECLSLLEERDVILELPAVFPRHIADVALLAERFPRLRIVIDHLGKPPIDGDEMPGWERDLRAAAAYPNVLAKLSGLNTATARPDWRADDFLPTFETALDCFGPERLMCGSDWPVLLLNGDYKRVWDVTMQLVHTIAAGDAAVILGENAARVYGFASPDRTTPSPAREDAWQYH